MEVELDAAGSRSGSAAEGTSVVDSVVDLDPPVVAVGCSGAGGSSIEVSGRRDVSLGDGSVVDDDVGPVVSVEDGPVELGEPDGDVDGAVRAAAAPVAPLFPGVVVVPVGWQEDCPAPTSIRRIIGGAGETKLSPRSVYTSTV